MTSRWIRVTTNWRPDPLSCCQAKGKLDVIQDSLQGVPPADIPRQRELLGRTTPPEPEHMPYLKRNKERRRRQSQRRSRTLSMDTTSVTIRDNTPGVARVEDSRSALDSNSPHVDTVESGALRKRIRQTSPDTQRGFLPPIVPDWHSASTVTLPYRSICETSPLVFLMLRICERKVLFHDHVYFIS